MPLSVQPKTVKVTYPCRAPHHAAQLWRPQLHSIGPPLHHNTTVTATPNLLGIELGIDNCTNIEPWRLDAPTARRRCPCTLRLKTTLSSFRSSILAGPNSGVSLPRTRSRNRRVQVCHNRCLPFSLVGSSSTATRGSKPAITGAFRRLGSSSTATSCCKPTARRASSRPVRSSTATIEK